jgi:hypothetical protein
MDRHAHPLNSNFRGCPPSTSRLSGPSFGIAAALFVIFTLARLLHTVTYVAEMQPWRSIFYEVGQIALVVTKILPRATPNSRSPASTASAVPSRRWKGFPSGRSGSKLRMLSRPSGERSNITRTASSTEARR